MRGQRTISIRKIHKGEHEPILDRALFEAVRQKLADQAVDRKLKGSASAFVLTGLIYDDRGNRMTPSHANKKGIRYRSMSRRPCCGTGRIMWGPSRGSRRQTWKPWFSKLSVNVRAVAGNQVPDM